MRDEGYLYVNSGINPGGIHRYDGSTGAYVDDFVPAGTAGLTLIVAGGLGFGPDINQDGVQDLFASSAISHELMIFDGVSGNHLRTLADSTLMTVGPGGLDFDVDGNLYVVGGNDNSDLDVLQYGDSSQAGFEVTLSSPSAVPVTVSYDTIDGTAIGGSDYASLSGTITFEPGVTSRTIIVPTFDDGAQEDNETFEITLSNAAGATLVVSEATGTILDDGDVGNQTPTADAGADQTLSDDDGTGGETVTLSGSGFDPDGSIEAYEWTDGVNLLGTTATISPSLSVGTHTLTLTVTDDEGATGSDTVVVTVDANQAPSADAGADQSAADADGNGDQVVTLTGSGSDPDGSITSYQWSDGATILGNAATISPTLSAGTHTLTFTVTDNGGATSSDSVVVTITANQAPTADAGSDQSITDGDDDGSEMVTLSGSGSDVDSSVVSYLWTEGATVLGTTASISPSLSVGTHTLTLTVTDNGGASTSDDVMITIVEPANQGPTATAGADQTLSDNDGTGSETVTLNGSGSDPDGTIVAYQWTEGATVLGNTASISPSLTVGTHTLTLTVTDDDGATASDSLVVTVVANQGPTVDAGADQTVIDSDDNGGETVTLTGTASDSDGSITSYQWSDGTNVIGTTASISPTLDVGTHTLTLTVTDNGGASSSDSVMVTVEAAPASGPNLSHGDIASVGSSWQTVTLGKSYTSMVVVATPRYNDGSGPGVVRIDNVTANSFDVRVDDAGMSSFIGGVHYIAVEKGVYDEPGCKLEAVKYDEAQTSRRSDWGIDTVGYQQSYSSPVVVGQVMSANDEDWSVFWASSGSRTSPPTSSALNVGKHVAEDPDGTRATETIGYLVIEATQNGTIEGLPFVAGVGSDTVRGVGNGTDQYSYDAMPNAKTAVLSSAGMDGNDGGWAVLRGDNPVPASSGTISLSIDEDQLRDSERNHTTEQVAYFVIDPPLADPAQNIAASVPLASVTPTFSTDVNGDGAVSALDALLIINRLNSDSKEEGDLALDTSQDGRITAIDALLVINRLNQNVESVPAGRDGLHSFAIDDYFATLDDEEKVLFGLVETPLG